MKLFYKLFFIASLFISLQSSLKAQLAVGDLVFTGYIASGPSSATDQFSFVPLVNLPVTTQIRFTDNGWNNITNSFTAVETVVIFTVVGSPIPPGREITIIPQAGTARYTNGVSAGTVSTTGAAFSLITTGDQLFAYQGPDATPTVIVTGIHMNLYVGGCGANTTAATWDDVCNIGSSNASTKPAALTTGTNAVWIGVAGDGLSEHDNAYFDCTGPLGTAAQVRAQVNNSANWNTEDPVGGAFPLTFTLPTGCSYLGLMPLPLGIKSFTGQLNSDKTVTLRWDVEDQHGVSEYQIEESRDGITYTMIGSEPKNIFTTYTFNDQQVSGGKTYYRLKVVELSGRSSYTNIVLINVKEGLVVSVYPNPVKDKFTIQQFGGLHNRTAVLSDIQGKVMQNIKITSQQQPVNIEGYTKGVYFLKLEDGTIFKIIKQ